MTGACGGGSAGNNVPVTEEPSLGSAATNENESATTDIEAPSEGNNNPDNPAPQTGEPETTESNTGTPDPEIDNETDIASNNSTAGGPIDTSSDLLYQALSQEIIDAVSTGDANPVDVTELMNTAVAFGESYYQDCVNTLEWVYPDTVSTATMPYLSNHTYSSHNRNYPLHVAAESGNVYSWLGKTENQTRYAYFGASIFRHKESDYWGNLGADLKDDILKTFAWITKHSSSSGVLQDTLRIHALSSRAQLQLEDWLNFHSITTNWSFTTGEDSFENGDYDLLIGLIDGNTLELDTPLNNEIPVMLWSELFDPGNSLKAFGLSWNWWGEAEIGNTVSAASQCEQAYPPNQLTRTIKNIRDDALQFDYQDEHCPVYVYKKICQLQNIKNSDNTSLQTAFFDGADLLKTRLKKSDYEGANIFEKSGVSLLTKLAVLIGDKLRQDIHYPMDKTESSSDFYRALFTEYATSTARGNNTSFPDSGTFSENFSNLSQLEPTNTVVTVDASRFTEWTSTGLSGQAGVPIVIQRTDDNPNGVAVRFNMIRSASTWLWNENGFSRPKFVTSNTVHIPPGGSVTISSPLGGPIYLLKEATSDGAPPYQLEFSNVIEHPMLTEFDSDAIQVFLSELDNTELDWVDVRTNHAEVHSQREKLKRSFDAQDGVLGNGYTNNDVIDWSYDLNQYLIESNLVYAGLYGADLSPANTNVQAFCTQYGIDCEDISLFQKPKVQHINADTNASCGDLCSGNPFDLNSYLKPLGYGESHEIGHNLQRTRLDFYGARSSETSNNIYPLHMAYRWLLDNGLGIHPSFRLPDSNHALTQLQESVTGNLSPDVNHPIWRDTGTYDNADVRLMLYLQLIYIHDQWEYDPETGGSGWDIYTKLNKLDRLFAEALSNELQWLAWKDKLGFSNYSFNQAHAINGNDFMAIALTRLANQDHRRYLRAWGIGISDTASMQIDTNGYEAEIELVYWKSPDDRFLRYKLPSRDLTNRLILSE